MKTRALLYVNWYFTVCLQLCRPYSALHISINYIHSVVFFNVGAIKLTFLFNKFWPRTTILYIYSMKINCYIYAGFFL